MSRTTQNIVTASVVCLLAASAVVTLALSVQGSNDTSKIAAVSLSTTTTASSLPIDEEPQAPDALKGRTVSTRDTTESTTTTERTTVRAIPPTTVTTKRSTTSVTTKQPTTTRPTTVTTRQPTTTRPTTVTTKQPTTTRPTTVTTKQPTTTRPTTSTSSQQTGKGNRSSLFGYLWGDGKYQGDGKFFFRSSNRRIADNFRNSAYAHADAVTEGFNSPYWTFTVTINGSSGWANGVPANINSPTHFAAAVIEGEGSSSGKVLDDPSAGRRDSFAGLLNDLGVATRIEGQNVYSERDSWTTFNDWPFVACGRVPGGGPC